MKITARLLATIYFLFSAHPAPAAEGVPEELRSRLDAHAELSGVGKIAYRAPLAGNTGPVLVLNHGVYGGASHLAFRELLPRLDAKGFRVYLFDLPGAGGSVKKAKEYTIADLEGGLAGFLAGVVKEPATVVAESLAGVAALEVARREPALVKSVVMLQPTGVRTLAEAPGVAQNLLYETARSSEFAERQFFRLLTSEPVVRHYAKKAYYNDALVDALRVREGTLAGEDPEQRFLSISFVGGRIWKSFREASAGVKQPVLALFGANAESMGGGPEKVERPAEFTAILPSLKTETLPDCGGSVQREKPGEVARLIADFLR